MPVSGHLIALAGRSAEIELAERFLSPEKVLLEADARDLLELRSVVTKTHRDLASHRFPEGLMDPSDLARWLDEHRSQLAVLGDPSEFDYAELADSVDALVRLSARLQELPPAAWSSISRTSQEYAEASESAAGVASDLDHSVIVDPPQARAIAIALCEAYLGLDSSRFDEPLEQLIARHRQAQAHAAGSEVHGTFERHDRADELTRECEGALELLRRDRSGLLVRHVQDHRTHGHSSIDTLVQEAAGLVEGSRDAVGLMVTIEDGAPAFHELAAQAAQLREHLASGGKMSGLVRVPKAVREADELVRFVKVGGSAVDTVAEAERACDHLRFRTQLETIDSWAAAHGLQRPAGSSHHDWLTAIVGVPGASEQVRAACKRADELVRFAFGTAPDDPATFLAAALATVSKEVADALDSLAFVAGDGPSIHLAGLPIRSRDDARRALGSIRATARRTSLHAMLPEPWQSRCDPLDADDGDLLAEMLAVCAAAAQVPGPARTANLTPSAVNTIAERAQRDQRRRELLEERDRVIGRLHRTIVGCVPQSPATQSIAEAVRNEDPLAYRIGMEALEREVQMAGKAHRLDAVRQAAIQAHPQLIEALDLEDGRAVEVLASIQDFERVRDHQRAVRTWLAEIGSTEEVHAELRSLSHEARRAEQQLASLRCWDQAVQRLQDRRELRSALFALTSAMDAVPKTRTAKSYPARMRALRKATADAAPAIPCWVMTVDRVAEVLGYPTGEDRFDVVIVDEASQAWFPAMFLYAIADQVIVVGDKLQTSPATAVVGVDQMATIAREHIFGHRLEDRIGDDLSLYDVAEVMTGPDMMVDHFRCVPEIIDISNRLSYAPMGRSLQPSRVRAPGSLEPVIRVAVSGARAGSTGANEAEVEAIVAEVVRCHADPRYSELNFGVVVVGPNPVAQLKVLRTRLLDELGAQAMRERDLEVGTASQFQGAERHVMFLSLIVAPEKEERIRVWPHEHTGRNRRNVQQLNVAVSRARDQLWIFHSFHPAQLAPDDARAVLFGSGPTQVPSIEEQLEACDSKFERDVVVALAAADQTLDIRTQVEALGYSIDVVVEDQHGHRLAVECDGDRWHSTDTHIRSDLYRQRTLENIGWRFHRFLASEWYDDPDRHVRAILDELVRSEAPSSMRTAAQVRHSEPDVQLSAEDGDDPPIALGAGLDHAAWEPDAFDSGDSHDEGDDEPDEPDPAGELLGGLSGLIAAQLHHHHEQAREAGELLGGDGAVSMDRSVESDRAPEASVQPVVAFDDRRRNESPSSVPQRIPARAEAVRPSMETLTCQSCGAEWTRRRVRGRKPTRCGKCVSDRPAKKETHSGLAIKERNRRLAAALRDLGKEPNGAVWQRAKELLEAGHSFSEAARDA
jgi:very-short-patch-repair endonuclease